MAKLAVQDSDDSDSSVERRRRRKKKKSRKSKHRHRCVHSIMLYELSFHIPPPWFLCHCVLCTHNCSGLEGKQFCHLCRSKKQRRKHDSSEDESEDEESGEDGEEVWVEKKRKRDKDDAFVGPVPDLKVQAAVAKKE